MPIELTEEEEFARAVLESVHVTLVHEGERKYNLTTKRHGIIATGATVTNACIAAVSSGADHKPRFRAMLLLAASLTEDEDAVLSAASSLLDAVDEDEDEDEEIDDDDDSEEMERV